MDTENLLEQYFSNFNVQINQFGDIVESILAKILPLLIISQNREERDIQRTNIYWLTTIK